MVTRLFSWISLVFSLYLTYRFRYRIVNFALGQRWLRKAAVSLTMQIPYVRDRMMGRMMTRS